MPRLGHFRSGRAFDHFRAVYDAALAQLPPFDESVDVSTSFGAVRVYRFGAAEESPPVVLLPGRNASTPMWRANLPSLIGQRTVYCLDLLGEAGMSVQTRPLTGPEDQAAWVDETLAGLGLDRAHLMGVSIGGWTATNCAVHRPDRVASLTLLDPAMTFARIPVRAVVVSAALFLPVPEVLRRSVFSWISGGAPVDESVPEAESLSAASADFVLRAPMPKVFTDDQLRSVRMPVLALLAGRSVMHDAARAAARARNLLPYGQLELWPDASHAINGEYPGEIAEVAAAFWRGVDGAGSEPI
ncbi:alpha/beta fold hydrolase [Mycobacterium sp. URHB0044]|uniref:alpha/beta fold hydrolase n=1 Tax=Mycobacterium sp. URHB0044 TaxID=1380386 RepID=UPI00048B13D1|nr:alpha/beta hydrolase [Mycobacterium sp. URHB0044]